jgi:K+-transporting ATPase ATPase C chain
MNRTNHIIDMYNPGLLTAARSALVLIILCGGLYPSVTAVIGGWLFPRQATGSLIYRDGVAIGSELVGQSFNSDHYFYGRPSAVGYNPFSVSGSNWAPSNPDLGKRAADDSHRIQEMEGVNMEQIPADMLAASGSGIDPHITPEAAMMQAGRVARARGLNIDAVIQLISDHTEPPQWGIFGQPRVHVLRLNLALDAG